MDEEYVVTSKSASAPGFILVTLQRKPDETKMTNHAPQVQLLMSIAEARVVDPHTSVTLTLTVN